MKTLLAAALALLAGCASTVSARSYVRNVWVDPAGSVTAVERCDLVAREVHRLHPRVTDISTQNCEVTPPAFAPTPPPLSAVPPTPHATGAALPPATGA